MFLYFQEAPGVGAPAPDAPPAVNEDMVDAERVGL